MSANPPGTVSNAGQLTVPENQPEPPRKCGNCDFWRRMREEHPDGVCFLRPPVVHIVMLTTGGQTNDGKLMVPKDQQQVKMQQVPMSFRPVTLDSEKCAEHRFDDEPSDGVFAGEQLTELVKHGDRIARFLRDSIVAKR